MRQELFAATIKAGTIDWDDLEAAAEFAVRRNEIHKMLEAHAKHEDTHFFPLLAEKAPEVVAAEQASHHITAVALTTLTNNIDAVAATPTRNGGLAIYRELSAFVAHYLLHQLDEETTVMPGIWRHCTDDEINAARSGFLADQSPAGVIRSHRAMLPAISPAERAATVANLRVIKPTPLFDTVMADTEQLLEPADWVRLKNDLTVAEATPTDRPSARDGHAGRPSLWV